MQLLFPFCSDTFSERGMPIAQAILKSDQTPVCRLCERQTDTGGLNGRPEKREDVRFCCLLFQICKQAGSLVALDNAFECPDLKLVL